MKKLFEDLNEMTVGGKICPYCGSGSTSDMGEAKVCNNCGGVYEELPESEGKD